MASTLGAETDGDGAEEGAVEAASSLLLASPSLLVSLLASASLSSSLRCGRRMLLYTFLASSFSSCSMESAAAVSTETRSVGSASFSMSVLSGSR